MTVSNGDVIRVSARQELEDGQDHVSVFHYIADFQSDQTDQTVVDAVMEEIDNAFGALNGYISNTTSKVDMKFDKVEFIGGVLEQVYNLGTYLWTGATYTPAGSGETLPPGVAALCKFTTVLGRVYGRKFLGGLIEGAQNGGTLVAGCLTALASFGATILTDVVIDASNSLAAGVMSSKVSGYVGFQEADASDNVAYQRRRRVGTGS